MNLRNKALAACCSIALGAGPACAEGYEQGRAAYKNGQHREAYELFRAGAENDPTSIKPFSDLGRRSFIMRL